MKIFVNRFNRYISIDTKLPINSIQLYRYNYIDKQIPIHHSQKQPQNHTRTTQKRIYNYSIKYTQNPQKVSSTRKHITTYSQKYRKNQTFSFAYFTTYFIILSFPNFLPLKTAILPYFRVLHKSMNN